MGAQIYGNQCSLPVPDYLRSYSLTTKEDFETCTSSSTQHGFEIPACTESEVLFRYMDFLAMLRDGRTQILRGCDIELVEIALTEIREKHMSGAEIHRFAANLTCDEPGKLAVIRSYYNALKFTKEPIGRQRPALFDASMMQNSTSIYVVFGGQGNTEHYFDELKTLYATYYPLLGNFLHKLSKVLNDLATELGIDSHYCQGIDFLSWLRNPTDAPSVKYLLLAPISFPLIGLTQLVHYYVLCKILGIEPGEFLSHLKGMTGHSQGIVVAAALATVDTMQEFEVVAEKALKILFYVGYRSQERYSERVISQRVIQLDVETGNERPTPMLNVTRLSGAQLQHEVDLINSHLAQEMHVEIVLVNGRRNFVVGGPPLSLLGLDKHLRGLKAPDGLDQSRTPFMKRRPEIVTRFLPITAPFHSSHLRSAAECINQDLRRHGISLKSNDLKTAVYHTMTGDNLATMPDTDLCPLLVRMIITEQVNWPKATVLPGATHILDFGPGGLSGVGALLSRDKEGQGARVILATVIDGASSDFGYRPEIFDPQDTKPSQADWAKACGPRLLKNSSGKIMVDTRFSRLFGLPPLMIAGMTPTTVPVDFVAASINAGYHIEWASGGYFDADSLTRAICQLSDDIPPGRGITINLIYSKPSAIQWQIPCIQKCQASGHNIEGITFGAGVPSVEIASELVRTLDLKHISFKPGSVDAIKQVITIAKMNPGFPVLLQWTSGRAGGHHSYEDFHDPILRMYGRIRRSENIILIAGSGFGGIDDTYPYLTGSWSRAFGYSDMPFDACLFGSRMMVAKEAHTSKAAKEVIARVDGLCDERWHDTYRGNAGGIITVTSELGQPIHKIATRGVELWAELDRTIFSLDKKKQVLELAKKRSYIIGRLNRDFQKVWFGGSKGLDLRQMKYGEVLERLIELLYVKDQSRWIDPSYPQLVDDYIRRLQERLSIFMTASKSPQCYHNYDLQAPENLLRNVLKDYPSAANQLITAEDEQFLLMLFRRRSQKPVPFIPVLDENFETYFKKDSLWQSEDIEAVVDRDVQRTCILHGPMAAQYSNLGNIDEPVKVIMNNIHEGHIEHLLRDLYHGSADRVPVVDYFGGDHIIKHGNSKDKIGEIRDGDRLIFTLGSKGAELPASDVWFQILAGESKCWRHALFTTEKIVIGRKLFANPIRRIFAPKPDICVEISSQHEEIASIVMRDAKSQTLLLTIEPEKAGDIKISIIGPSSADGEDTILDLCFAYHPETPGALIHEIVRNRNERIKSFYRQIWIGENEGEGIVADPSKSVMLGEPFSVDDTTIKEFIGAIVSANAEPIANSEGILKAPMDFGIVIAWKAIMKALLLVDGDLLRLVHLSNKFEMLGKDTEFEASNTFDSTAKIVSIVIRDSGKMVEICATITNKNIPVMAITSQFLYRGEYRDFSECFLAVEEPEMHFSPSSPTQVALLISKDWWEASAQYPNASLLGCDLFIQLKNFVVWDIKDAVKNIHTTGQVLVRESATQELVEVATINCKSTALFDGSSFTTPVADFFQRHGSTIAHEAPLKTPIPCGKREGISFTAPASNVAYARVSKDLNPIHLSDIFARYADLPGPITHGMHTSAIVRSICETWCVGSSYSGRMKSFETSFCGMVKPGDELEVEMQHVAMRQGRKIFAVEARNKTSKEKVVVGRCEVEEGSTAYFFTGQGSQELKMGMDLYKTSRVARELWDRADRHFEETYGFKISHIVKENPKKLTVHFGGRRGTEIRQNYLRMTYEYQADDGSKSMKNFFDINTNSRSYTYHSPTGLLNSTEFTQPALAIMEKAIYDDMIDQNVLIHNSKFAGHSLGEYSALAAIANIMPIERLLSVVFYRGLSMRVSVPRDSLGRSNYGMMAISPQRISKDFSVEDLHKLISLVQTETNCLLEIVNYNISLQQYVCAGELLALKILTECANHLHAHPLSFNTLTSTTLTPILQNLRRHNENEHHITLDRGKATIPLPGIDVPFHSKFLLPYLPAFREVLLQNIDQAAIDPSKIVGRYVPNVTARPFEITREAFEDAWRVTGSERLGKVLEEWEECYAGGMEN